MCAAKTLELDFAHPVDTDHIRVTQLLTGFRNRSITDLDLRFDGKDTVPFDLDDSSRSADRASRCSFPRRTFSKVELIIRDDDSRPGVEAVAVPCGSPA